jgi:hypothetical protein
MLEGMSYIESMKSIIAHFSGEVNLFRHLFSPSLDYIAITALLVMQLEWAESAYLVKLPTVG